MHSFEQMDNCPQNPDNVPRICRSDGTSSAFSQFFDNEPIELLGFGRIYEDSFVGSAGPDRSSPFLPRCSPFVDSVPSTVDRDPAPSLYSQSTALDTQADSVELRDALDNKARDSASFDMTYTSAPNDGMMAATDTVASLYANYVEVNAKSQHPLNNVYEIPSVIEAGSYEMLPQDIKKQEMMAASHAADGISRKNSKRVKKPKTCPVCGKELRRDLSRHMRTHRTSSDYTCPFPKRMCPRSRRTFNRRYEYKNHIIMNHSGEHSRAALRKAPNLTKKLQLGGSCCCGAVFETMEDWVTLHVNTKECKYLQHEEEDDDDDDDDEDDDEDAYQ